LKKLFCLMVAVLLAVVTVSPGLAGEKVFVEGRAADSLTLDPHDATDGPSNGVLLQIFDTLVKFRDDSTEIVPSLATEWKTSEDGLTWTFKLRRDVRFHDGTPFNADAVVFSFERQRDEKHPAHEGKFAYWSYMFSNVEYTKKIDDFTVEMKLKEPYSPFLSNLACYPGRIVSPTAMSEKGVEHFRSNPVGTGPFRFAEWKRNDILVLVANRDYWGEEGPYLDKLIFRVIPDDTARLMALLADEIDGMGGVTPETIKILKEKKRSDIKVVANVGMNTGYLAMNMSVKPFDNPKVRRAIAHCVDKEQIVREIFQSMGKPAKNIIPDTLWGYNDDIVDYDYDLEKAKKLLDEAGYPEGFETELWYMPVSRPYMPNSKHVAQVIQRDLGRVGIKAKLVTFDWGTYLSKLHNLEHSMCLCGWLGDNGDPDNFLYALFDKDNAEKGSAQNYACYLSEEYHQLMLKAQRVADVEKRSAFYREAQVIFHEDVPAVPLAHGFNLALVKGNVRNFIFDPQGANNFQKVDLEL